MRMIWSPLTAVAAGAALLLVPAMNVSSVEAQQTPPRTVQPGAPGEAGRVIGPDEVIGIDFPTYTEADVRFMRMMIPHHEQALEMAELVPDRTSRNDIRMLALRILASQQDEIALMERWLADRDELESDPHEGHGAHDAHTGHGAPAGGHDDHSDMPGMLSSEQMANLAAASGIEFDRLFLEYMIEHHEGAIVMVQELFSSPGGGQEGDIYQLASHIDSDQRMEIERMRRLYFQLR